MKMQIALLLICAVSTSCTRTAELKGKTLNLYLKDNIKSGDPVGAYDTVSLEPLPQVYESPYQYSYYKKAKVVEPLLAAAMPKYSADRLTVTFPLRKGVMFQDDACFADGKGREVKAQDFIYGWKRHVITRLASEGFWIFDAKIVGFNDFQAKFKDEKSEDVIMATEIEGMKALDDYTIQIKLTKPYPQLLNVLSMTFAAPVAIEAVKKYQQDFVNHPVGTGPFRVLSWQPQSKVILVKNPSFRDVTFPATQEIDEEFKEVRAYSGKKLPLVDNVVFRIMKEEQPRWLEHIAGNIDQIEIPKDNLANAVRADDVKVLNDEFTKKGFKLSIENGVVYWYLIINMKDKLLGENKLLRQALSSTIDRAAFLKLHRNGRGTTATEWNPVGVNDRCGKRTKLKYDFDLVKAKQLLAKAGYPEGKGLPAITFDLRGADSTSRQIGEFISKSLDAVGVKINLVLNTFPAYLQKRAQNNLQFSMGGWNMDYPDAENNMQLLFGPNESPGPNESNYKNARYDELYKKIAAMPSSPARAAAICEMDELVQEDVPVIMSHYESLYRMATPRLKNFHTAEVVQNKYKYVDVVTP